MRVFSLLLLATLAVLAVSETPAASSTGAAAPVLANPPAGPVSDLPKSTPGRHCELRSGCGDCLAINYCVWSPSRNLCLDKHKATRKDDVVHTCDPDECAKHGGPKPVDRRPAAHVSADIVNSRGRRVVASAVAVDKLRPAAVLPERDAKHLSGRSFPATSSDDAHVVVKPGKRRMVFSSDSNAPIIRGEREERRRRYLRERREHARQVYEQELCERARGCGAKKPAKKQYARPEYYPDPKQNRTQRIAQFRADHADHDRELRRTLRQLRERADYTLHHRSGMIAAKRRRIQDLLDQVSRSINDVNTQAYAIDHDEAVYQRLHKQVQALESKIHWACDAPNSAFLELGVELTTESDADVDAEAEAEVAAEDAADAEADSVSEQEIAEQASQEVAAEEAAEAEDFATADAAGEADSAAEQEINESGELSAEQMEERVAQLQEYAEYPEPIAMN